MPALVLAGDGEPGKQDGRDGTVLRLALEQSPGRGGWLDLRGRKRVIPDHPRRVLDKRGDEDACSAAGVASTGVAPEPVVERRLAAIKRGRIVLWGERLRASIAHASVEDALGSEQLAQALGLARRAIEQLDELLPRGVIEHEARAIGENPLRFADSGADNEVGEVAMRGQSCGTHDLVGRFRNPQGPTRILKLGHSAKCTANGRTSRVGGGSPSLDDSMLEWAAIWKALPKVVFSTTPSAVQGNARLASGGLEEEIERLRAEPGESDIAIGGATLAAEATALGLIDEYRARVCPVLVGGGIPFFPQRERRVDLELVETHTFSSRVVYLRYRLAR